MKYLSPIRSFFIELSNIPVTDPDDSRRRKLLNIILLGTAVVALILLIAAPVIANMGVVPQDDGVRMVFIAIITLIILAIILVVNRYISGRFASTLFLLFLMVVLALSDDPAEVVNGRSTYVFVIPIIISSVLLAPSASFIFYVLSCIEMVLISITSVVPPNTPAIAVYLLLALISWLSSRSLEQALHELRAINVELDQRVAERTNELSDALTREHAEASRRQAILQGIADGVLVLNNDGEVIMCNMATSRLLETPIEQIMRHNIEDILHSSMLSEEDREILMQTIGAADVTMAPMRVRWDKRTLSIKAAPVRDAKGQAIGNVAVLRDFTREAEVEEMKNTFVSMVSHELRTPLNAILGYSEMLRDAIYGSVNDKQANAADRILKNSRRLLDIVSDLLDKAQIEAGHLALHYEQFKTADVLENMHSVMDQIATDKGLTLTSSIAPEMPEMIDSDPQRLQQILVNLVNNAIKFTEEGGIDVRLYRVTDEHWAFDVTDTGPGIAIEDQKFIFDPFRQVEGTVTRAHGGIGLGLSIVNRIIDLMKGRIFVQSALGQGTTFTVILPFETPHKKE
jgi:PAS domain S-box-containing protein